MYFFMAFHRATLMTNYNYWPEIINVIAGDSLVDKLSYEIYFQLGKMKQGGNI